MKKVLILSLGTGDAAYRNMSGDIIEQMYDNNTFFSSYTSAEYKIDDDRPVRAEFMALPLIEKEKPDIVFLVGTMKSVWTALYSRFVTDEEKRSKTNMRKLYEIEKSGSYKSSDNEILESQENIQSIYDADGLFS